MPLRQGHFTVGQSQLTNAPAPVFASQVDVGLLGASKGIIESKSVNEAAPGTGLLSEFQQIVAEQGMPVTGAYQAALR